MDLSKYYIKRKPKECPKCGKNTIASILYGMPAFSEELEKKIDLGTIKLGGCCISTDDPSWFCTSCETELFKENKNNI